MAHIVFGPDGSGNYQHALNTWHYPTTANYHGEKEEGLIAVQFWWNDGAGGGAPNCLGSVIIPYDACMIGMHMLIDGCGEAKAMILALSGLWIQTRSIMTLIGI
ncbi:hypothetical protein LTR95_016490 [Oleoguttula sp. CCFEE 5521]